MVGHSFLLDVCTLLLSSAAIGLSIIAIIQQQKFFNYNREEKKPLCHVSVTSIGREFSIHFSNAGASAMKVDMITFRVGNSKPIESLSSIFNDIPVDKQSVGDCTILLSTPRAKAI